MKLATSLLAGVAAVLCSTSLSFAQTGGGANPGGSTGAPAAPGAPLSRKPDQLDLPLPPAKLEVPIPPKAPPENTPIEDDPRGDPPTLYGEPLESETETIFYVIDISCSMDWDSQSYTTLDGRRRQGTRMDRAKAELGRSIMGLGDNFKFNIIAYDCGMRSWKRSMVEATPANKQDGLGWVMGLQPTGATGTGPATAAALGDKSNKLVVLLTDGAPNCGANSDSGHRSMIRSANTQRAKVNVFGIAAYGSYRAFCQGVASDNGGSYFDVP